MLVENDITNFSQLKEELLKEIRISENKILDTIKKQTQEINHLKNDRILKFESIANKNKEILESIVNQKMKFEKIDEFEMFKTKINDMIITHDIRINNSINEISQMKTKYDKIFTDNLTIPGYVGPSCKYKSISEYIYANISEISKLKNDKEVVKKELKETKVKMESLMTSTLSLVNGTVGRCNEYCNESLKSLNKNISNNLKKNSEKIENLENLINNIKEESEVKLDVLNKDINKFDYKIIKLKNDYIELIEEKTNEIIQPKIEEINKTINSFYENLEIFKIQMQQFDLKTANFDNSINDNQSKNLKILNDFNLNNKLSNLINSPVSDRKNTSDEKNLKNDITNNNSLNNISNRVIEKKKTFETTNNNNNKKIMSVKNKIKEKEILKQKINTKNNLYSNFIANKNKNYNTEDSDSVITTERIGTKPQIYSQTNERNKGKNILTSIDNKTKSDYSENKKNEIEINIYNNKLKNISNKSFSHIIKKNNDINKDQNLIFNKNTPFLNENSKTLNNFTTKDKDKKFNEIPYLINNNNNISIFTNSYSINNNKVNINGNKSNKTKISNGTDTANSLKLLNSNKNDCGIECYTDNNSNNKNNINQEAGNIYRLASIGYGLNNFNGKIETYCLAAEHSNNKRSVDLGTVSPLDPMRLTGFKYHKTNSNDKIDNEISHKIGSVFGSTVYNVYNKKEEKYKNLTMITKNIKMKKTPSQDNRLNISLVPVAKIKICK